MYRETLIGKKPRSKETVKLKVGFRGGHREEELYTILTKGNTL